MIKNIFLVLFASLLLTVGSIADGTANNEFEKVENNVIVNFGDLTVGHRSYVDDDEAQLILGYNVWDSLQVLYKNVTGVGEDQHKFRLTHNTFQVGNFYANAVVEYIMKTDDGDDVVRVRPEVGVAFPITDKLSAGYSFSPHWDVDQDEDSWLWEHNHYRHVAGVDYQINDQFSFVVCAEIHRDAENKLQEQFLGTELRFNFPALAIFHK